MEAFFWRFHCAFWCLFLGIQSNLPLKLLSQDGISGSCRFVFSQIRLLIQNLKPLLRNGLCRARHIQKCSLPLPPEFCIFFQSERKLLKSTGPTGSLPCPGPSVSAICRALLWNLGPVMPISTYTILENFCLRSLTKWDNVDFLCVNFS